MALYRKYRPATFAEVVGQEHVTDPLSTALDTGRISHAYLFSGPRGCGKTSSARILARSLNCVEGPTSRPCGVCSSCVALAPGGSGNLDVIELDAASHGGVDDTRELRDRAFYAPAESRYRVFIVDEAHMVTTAGFNALLKIVEEPPAHLIFIFATTEPDKVLPTIRSRTHHYPFRLLPPATMRGLLGKICDQEQVQVEEAVYPLVIRAGGGSPRDSLSVLDQLLAGAGSEGVTYPRALALLGVTDIALIDEAVDALAGDDGAALFGTVDRVVEAGHDPRRFATDLLERVRDLILLRAVPDAAERNLVTGPGDVIDRMSAQAERIGPATLARYAELLHEGLGEMRGATAPRLLLEVICARMLLPSVSDAETAALQRLERLERRMDSGVVPVAAPQSVASRSPGRPPEAEADPGAARSSGEPRRRGAEALAALREKKSAPHPAQRAQSPTGPQSQPSQDLSTPETPTAPAPPAPAPAEPDQAAPLAEPDQVTVPSAADEVVAPDSVPAAAQSPGPDDSVPEPSPVAATGSRMDADAEAPAAPDAEPGARAADEGIADHGAVAEPVDPALVEPVAAELEADAAAPSPVSAGPAAAAESVAESAVESESAVEDAASGDAADTSEEFAPAGAEPESAPAGDTLREIEAAWADIRAKVREFGAAVHALLSGASVARVDGETIVFAHQHAPLAQRLSNPQYVEAVQSAVQAVVGRHYDVRWEVGSGAAAGGTRAGGAERSPGRGAAADRPGGRGAGSGQAQAPRYTRPSQAQAQGGESDARGGADGRGSSGHAQRRESHASGSGSAGGRGEPDDDIPPPEAPDLPDDPGPQDYSPVGYDGVPPALTPEEEQEMLAESARPVPPEERRDPDDVALELLRTELGATRLGG
ncbi:DNA polymerase III subunit gamma and tau [Nocardia spumae]|uniref:DNA polymerase III subunit gamma and tau n=1 Tax=Nocardia spumae TaxID=2887190 RepID=UPI001D14ACE5|nr:DNA polymerase III subunit gamma and tau [Nocardia spumae]